MEREIREQPAALRRVLDAYVDGDRISLGPLALDSDRLSKLREIRLVGCGTAAHAAQLTSHLIESLAKLPARAQLASELREHGPLLGSSHWLIAISHSGETAETLAALRCAHALGCPTSSITSASDSTLAREADAHICTHSGVERAIPSTKGFMTQLAIGYLVALELARLRAALSDAERTTALQVLARLPDLLEQALELWQPVLEIARCYRSARGWCFVGRGLGHAIAVEGALKLQETSYVGAEGIALGELRHGPIAMLDDTTPVVLLAHASERRRAWAELAGELCAIGAPRIVIAQRDAEDVRAWSEHTLWLPAAPEPLASMLAVVPLQMLAHHVARLRGNDVDHPRHLTKSVTRE